MATPRDGSNKKDLDLGEVHSLLSSVSSALTDEAGKAVFAVGGQIALPGSGASDSGGPSNGHKQVTIRWDTGVGNQCLRASLPVGEDAASRDAFSELVNSCEPATFGRGSEDVFDETYRKAGKMDEACFSTDFNPYEYGVVDVVSRSLAQRDHYGVRAELYKLNVHSGPSGMFKPHADTPRAAAQMGSLVVCLPYAHKGGQLAVRHGGREVVFDWAAVLNLKAATVQWAAFFSDCEHEVLEVTAGHRLTLACNLFWISDGPTSMTDRLAVLEPESLHFFGALQNLLACPSFLPNGMLITPASLDREKDAQLNPSNRRNTCIHLLACVSPQLQCLLTRISRELTKGLDMVVYQALKHLTGSARVRGVIDERGRTDYVDSEPDSPVSPAPEDSYTTIYAAGKTVAGPDVAHGCSEDVFIDLMGDDYLHRRQKFTWLNHEPNKTTPAELAMAWITYGNQHDLDYYYSCAVILADFRSQQS